VTSVRVRQMLDMPTFGRNHQNNSAVEQHALLERDTQLNSLGAKIQEALTELVRQKLVTVRRGRTYLEVEIQSDILFASGVAQPSAVASATVRKLAAVLREAPNALRVEGYTDNVPINTVQFQSNWELSAARAASVVHVLVAEGIGADRLAVVGYGQHQPIADNATVEGRNANRRVLLVILAAPQGPDAVPDKTPAIALGEAPPVPMQQATPATTAPSTTAIGTVAIHAPAGIPRVTPHAASPAATATPPAAATHEVQAPSIHSAMTAPPATVYARLASDSEAG
jgi:chemotaxis protein MotB